MEPNKIPPNFYIKRDTTTGEVTVISRWKGWMLKKLSEKQAKPGYEIKKGEEAWETPGAKDAWEAKHGKIEPLEQKGRIKDITEISKSKLSAEKISKTPRREAQSIQKELNRRHISLTCREFTPPEPAKRNKLNHQALNEYLEAVRADFKLEFQNGPQRLSDEKIDQLIAAKRRLFDETQCFTYEDLDGALSECTQKLNTALYGQNYAVGYAEQKSQKWIAELALPFMEKTPQNAFPTYAEGAQSSVQGKLSDEIENCVVFDDASYSGSQMANLLEELVKEMKTLPTQKQRKIYFVVPFMSAQAKERLQNTMEQLRQKTPAAPFPELCIITSDKKLTGFSEVFPPDSQAIKDLFEFELQEKSRELYKLDPKLSTAEHDARMQKFEEFLKERYTSDKCLALTEWKTPDTVSVPSFLVGSSFQYLDDKQNPAEKFFHFLDTDFHPPYKTPPAK